MDCCKNCPDRWVDVENGKTCHSVCERYKQMQAELERVHKARAADATLMTKAAKKRRERWIKGGAKR